MYRHVDSLLFSASDLANFLDCEHLTTLDRRNVDEPLPRAPDDDSAKLVQAKGFAHEERYLAQARTVHATFVNVAEAETTLDGRVGRTLRAMHNGVDLIYQAAFRDQSLIGHADFLRRVSRPSSMGDFGYEIVDTKLARTPRARFLIQTTHYSHLLAKAQGVEPVLMHVVLGDGTERSFRYADYVRYYRALLQRFLRHVDTGTVSTYPEPRAHCDLCHWREVCRATWAQDDHLSLVAGISRVQTTKLMTAGIPTLRALAELPATFAIPKMAPATLDRIRNQARLQLLARESGERQVELLPERLDESRGFRRLPRPDDGDLFFDMEGDPFEEGGLEYGACYQCADVVLLYPHHAELGESAGVRCRLVVNETPAAANAKSRRRIRVTSIDLRDLAKVPEQLRALFTC